MPALPKHQPEGATWKKPNGPGGSPISIHYPGPPSLNAVGPPKHAVQPAASGQHNKAKKWKMAKSGPLQSLPRPQAAEAEAEARGEAGAWGRRQQLGHDLPSREGVADSGKAEASHYHPQGLKPTPVARALAGPTVHILVEGYVSYC